MVLGKTYVGAPLSAELVRHRSLCLDASWRGTDPRTSDLAGIS